MAYYNRFDKCRGLARASAFSVLVAFVTFASPAYCLDNSFDNGKSALSIPFEFDGKHIFVRLVVNDSKPLLFILDTGASHSILALRHAESARMSMNRMGHVKEATGAEDLQAFSIADKVSMRLPGVRISNVHLVAVSLEPMQKCFDKASKGGVGTKDPSPRKNETGLSHKIIDGILGKDFFSNFVVEIDYAGRRLNLYDPPSYKHSRRGSRFALEIEGSFTFVRGRVKARGRPPVNVRLVLDTGAGIALWLTERFARVNGLMPPAQKLVGFADCGAAGSAKEESWYGKVDALLLGRLVLRRPTTVFYQKPEIEGADGFLGNPALMRFNVVVDYSRRLMILDKRRKTGH